MSYVKRLIEDMFEMLYKGRPLSEISEKTGESVESIMDFMKSDTYRSMMQEAWEIERHQLH